VDAQDRACFLSPAENGSIVADLTLRRYEPSDCGAVLDLHERALRDAGAYADDLPDGAEADLDDVEAAYLERGGEFLVGERDGEIVAMGAFRPFEGSEAFDYPERDVPTAEIKRMRVSPEYQRQGYGEHVLRALEERAHERGRQRLVLDTGIEMTAAQSFYESHGFEQVGREEFPEYGVAVLLYERRLASP